MNNKLKDKQDELSKFVSREVYLCQSMLVEELLKNKTLEYDNIANLYAEDENEKEGTEQDYPQEIFEWWACSDWLLDRLEDRGEPVLRSELGDWWGRCTTGQAIILDGVIEQIYDDMSR